MRTNKKKKEEHSDNKSNMIKKSSIKIINFNDNNNQQNQQKISFGLRSSFLTILSSKVTLFSFLLTTFSSGLV